jgi:hypothetical protein
MVCQVTPRCFITLAGACMKIFSLRLAAAIPKARSLHNRYNRALDNSMDILYIWIYFNRGFMTKITLSNLNTNAGGTRKVEKSHARYWMGDLLDHFERYDGNDSTAMAERALRLSQIQRATANFVRILTNNPDIRVEYQAKGTSRTDGKTVYITAQDDPTKFDVMVGLALHEAGHCLLTPMLFYEAFVNSQNVHYFNGMIPLHLNNNATHYAGTKNMAAKWSKMFHPEFAPLIQKWVYDNDFATVEHFCNTLMIMMNIIEDRRIDQYVYTNAPGYRPYYEALYKEYFMSK